MQDKKKIIICSVVAIVIVAGIIAGVFIGKRNADKNTDVDNSTTSTTTTTNTTITEEEKTEPSTDTATNTTPEYSHKVPTATGDIKFEGGVARGICTYKGVDYVATEEGLFAVTESGKKKLTSQSAGNYLSIIDDKIYYSVETKIVKEYFGDNSEDYVNWLLCEGWVMNLDGSGQKKLVDFIGDGFIICADDNAIYYAESPGPGLYTAGIGYYIYKNDLKTGKKTLIDDGTVVYVDEDGEKDVWQESVDNILYHDDCIYFKHYTCDGSYVRAAKYNIKTGKKTEITDVCQQLYLAKDGTVYLIVGEEIDPDDDTYEFNECLASYSPENNKINIIKRYNYYGVQIFDSDANNVYVDCSVYDSGKTLLAYYNNKDGYKEFFAKNEWLSHVYKYDSVTGTLIYIDDSQENETLIKELKDGKESVIQEVKNYGGYLTVAGKHCMVVDIYISEDIQAENDYYTEEIVLLK